MFVFQCHVKEEATVLLTKVFRNGNSQTVRIPPEIADTNADIALEIERVDDELGIRPVRRSLAGILKKFAQFSPHFMADGRGYQEQGQREARRSLTLSCIPIGVSI